MEKIILTLILACLKKINLSATDLSVILTKLDNINSLLISSTSADLIFTPINISNAAITINSNNGWVTAPTNLQNIVDANEETSTNQFEVGGSNSHWGEVVITTAITPQITRINFKVGIASNNPPNRPAATLEINKGGTEWVGIWSFFGRNVTWSNANDFKITIDVIVPYTWTDLKLKIFDLGNYGTRAIIYDLKVYAVS